MKLKKLIALALTFVLTLGLTGCVGHLYPSVMTVNGKQISSGLYLLFQFNAYNTASSKVEDPTKDPLKQKIEGASSKSWIKNTAEEAAKRFVAVQALAENHDIALSDTDRSSIDQTVSSYWTYFEATYNKNGIAHSTVYRHFENQQLSELLFSKLYGDGGSLTPTDDELKRRYEEKYAHLQFISIPLTDEANLPVTVPQPAIEAAEKLVEKLKAGSSMEEIAQNNLTDVYKFLPREFDASTALDNITTSYLGYDPKTNTLYPEDFLQELNAATVGSFGIYTSDTSILIYEKIAAFENEAAFAERRATVVNDLCRDDFENHLKEAYATYPVQKVFGAQTFFSPAKIAL